MNIHGFCPNCNADFDGELVVDTFIQQGKTPEEAVNSASYYAGWEEHGKLNRWSRKIGIYSLERDMTTNYRCPDCNHEWSRF